MEYRYWFACWRFDHGGRRRRRTSIGRRVAMLDGINQRLPLRAAFAWRPCHLTLLREKSRGIYRTACIFQAIPILLILPALSDSVEREAIQMTKKMRPSQSLCWFPMISIVVLSKQKCDCKRRSRPPKQRVAREAAASRWSEVVLGASPLSLLQPWLWFLPRRLAEGFVLSFWPTRAMRERCSDVGKI